MRHRNSLPLSKYISHRVIAIDGHPTPCECTDLITCAYCVQANLILMEKKLAKGDDIVKASIKAIRKNGIRKTARQIGEHENTVRRWIKSENIPQKIVEKLAELRTSA